MSLISIKGVQLEVRQVEAAPGARQRAPIVFLHEGLGSVAMWRDWPRQVCLATGRGDCHRISAPVLAIQGLDDPYGSMQQIEQIRPSGWRCVLQKLEQCGHLPHRDQPTLTTQLITDFLASEG